MTPIDFEVARSRVKVTGALNKKLVRPITFDSFDPLSLYLVWR
jgi:hypothetical protein